jgi:hypothetical protein
MGKRFLIIYELFKALDGQNGFFAEVVVVKRLQMESFNLSDKPCAAL